MEVIIAIILWAFFLSVEFNTEIYSYMHKCTFIVYTHRNINYSCFFSVNFKYTFKID